MSICELCRQFQDARCNFGLRLPLRMSCRHFEPGIEKFCANPVDFVSAAQIMQMASFFGLKGSELKKVKRMAETEEASRSTAAGETASLSNKQESIESV